MESVHFLSYLNIVELNPEPYMQLCKASEYYNGSNVKKSNQIINSI